MAGRGGSAKKPGSGGVNVVDVLYNQVPSFTDVFDEETFYIFVFIFVMTTLVAVFIGSRYITLKPLD